MKYALRFEPTNDTIETTMWVWFQKHGIYYVNDRDGVVQEAEPDFIDSNLEPDYSDDVVRVSFDDVPDHVHGHDPREIIGKLPKEYAEDGEWP